MRKYSKAHTLYVDYVVAHTLYVDYVVAHTLYVDHVLAHTLYVDYVVANTLYVVAHSAICRCSHLSILALWSLISLTGNQLGICLMRTSPGCPPS
jgi:hypothetical protein